MWLVASPGSGAVSGTGGVGAMFCASAAIVEPRSAPGAVFTKSLSTVLPGVPLVESSAVARSDDDGASPTPGTPSDDATFGAGGEAALPDPADAASGSV